MVLHSVNIGYIKGFNIRIICVPICPFIESAWGRGPTRHIPALMVHVSWGVATPCRLPTPARRVSSAQVVIAVAVAGRRQPFILDDFPLGDWTKKKHHSVSLPPLVRWHISRPLIAAPYRNKPSRASTSCVVTDDHRHHEVQTRPHLPSHEGNIIRLQDTRLCRTHSRR